MQTARLDDTHGMRTWVLVLETGEEAKNGITSWATQIGTDAAQFTAIGAF